MPLCSVCLVLRQHLPFIKKATLLIFLTYASIVLNAQTDIRFQHITVDDGLSQSSISSMVQDKFGYLWIGTRDGLNRYDGSTFVTYLHDKKPHSLPRRSISGLYLDHKEQLWVVYTNGVSLYQPAFDHFDNYALWPDSTSNLYIRDFDAVDDSTVLLSSNHGVFRFNPLNGKFSLADDYIKFREKSITNMILSDPTFTWVSSDTVVWRQRRGDTAWEEVYRNQGRIKISYFEKTKELYLRTEFKLLKYDADSSRFDVIATLASSQWPVSESMLKTSDDHLWVAHGDVSVFDGEDKLIYRGRHVLEDPNSLSGPFASVIYETRDGVVWIGTNGLGINKYDPYRSVFNYIGHYPGADVTLWDNYITSIYSEDDTHLLVGTLEGVSLIDLEKRKSVYKPIVGKDGRSGRVQDVFKDSSNRTWLCTNRGLMQLEGQTIKPSSIKQFDDPDLNIFDVAIVDTHQFLFATSTSVYLWDQRKNRVEKVFAYGTPVIKKIGDEYWLESGNQIRALDLRTKQIARVFPRNGSDSLRAPLGPVKVIHVDSKSNVWIGTEGGGLSLYNAKDSTFRHYTEKDGLPNSVVYGILED
ncbi:MAG: ligand-binding sensor domain-containing protein, partial [Bacteroidota bacterium]